MSGIHQAVVGSFVFIEVPGPTLFAWGSNSYGLLGDPSITTPNVPNQVGLINNWSTVNGGSSQVFAIRTDGTMWAWGRNSYGGSLGINSNVYEKNSPTQIGALTTWSKVSGGQYWGIAVKTDGTLWSWGLNNIGQLGNNDTIARSSPIQVGALSTWANVFAGEQFWVATKTDGTLWGCGRNDGRQLGIGTGSSMSSPVQIGALTTWYEAAGGGSMCLATKTDGTLWGWGFNVHGQLGQNSSGNLFSSPVQIGALTNWGKLACSYDSVVATKTNGTMFSWGRNDTHGQLGLNDGISRSSPTQVGALTAWNTPGASRYSFLVTKTDGTLWSFGRNQAGQLGLNDTISRSSPVQVGALTTWTVVAGSFNTSFGIKTP